MRPTRPGIYSTETSLIFISDSGAGSRIPRPCLNSAPAIGQLGWVGRRSEDLIEEGSTEAVLEGPSGCYPGDGRPVRSKAAHGRTTSHPIRLHNPAFFAAEDVDSPGKIPPDQIRVSRSGRFGTPPGGGGTGHGAAPRRLGCRGCLARRQAPADSGAAIPAIPAGSCRAGSRRRPACRPQRRQLQHKTFHDIRRDQPLVEASAGAHIGGMGIPPIFSSRSASSSMIRGAMILPDHAATPYAFLRTGPGSSPGRGSSASRSRIAA